MTSLWHEMVKLVLKADCLSGAATQALEAGDTATAARMTAEMIEAIQQARKIAERMQAQ